MPEPVVFAIDRYDWMARQLAERCNLAEGRVERRTFPDAERYLRIITPVAERDVVLVGGTVDNTDTLNLYDLACGLVAEGARRLTIVCPYFGYATMERAVQPGEWQERDNSLPLGRFFPGEIPSLTHLQPIDKLDAPGGVLPTNPSRNPLFGLRWLDTALNLLAWCGTP